MISERVLRGIEEARLRLEACSPELKLAHAEFVASAPSKLARAFCSEGVKGRQFIIVVTEAEAEEFRQKQLGGK